MPKNSMDQDPADHTTVNNNTVNNSGAGTFNNTGIIGNISGGHVTSSTGQPSAAQATPPTQSEARRKTQPFDVCIVCALPEEARAVTKEFADRSEGVLFQRAFSKLTGYEYKHAVMHNDAGEQLKILVICTPFTGAVETVNSVRSLIEEFHPRFLAMAGICAGYREKVALGDLVAAAYAFSYEEGKVEADEHDQDRFRPEWRTHETARRVVQYLNNFDDWLDPLNEMKQLRLGRKLQPGEQPQCLVAPIASGMAVQGNNPFPRLLEHNRRAIFLDQEVAAFYQTLSEFPHVFFLAVKGVCDYGDKTKNDDYHDYAARASATYLLYFIQNYVTQDTMARTNNETN